MYLCMLDVSQTGVSVKPGLWTGLDYGLDWTGLAKTAVYRQLTPPDACGIHKKQSWMFKTFQRTHKESAQATFVEAY